MAVIDLRGSIERPLARIGGSVGQIISQIKDPGGKNREFRDVIRDNPQLVGVFSRMERQRPGSIKEIFPFLNESAISAVTSAPPSPKELEEAIEIPALTPVARGGTLTPETATALGEAARAQTVGMTPSELEIEPKKVVAAGEITQADVTAGERRRVTGLTPGQTAQDAFNVKIFTNAEAGFGELGLPEQQTAALRAKLPSAYFDADNQEMFRQRKAIAQMQIDAQNLQRANERTDAFQRSVGARWTERTKTGTPETWQAFLFTQGMNERGKGLAGGSILPQNQTDIRLMEVASAFSRADQVDKSLDEAAIKTQIGALIARIEKKDSEGSFNLERTVREALLNQLNDAFVELTNLTDGRIPLSIGDIKERGPVLSVFGEGNQPLKIIDEAGNEVDFSAELPGTPPAPPSPQEGIGLLNFETVDVSSLPEKTRGNLVAIMTGEGTFEQLQAFDPASAQLILDARRNR